MEALPISEDMLIDVRVRFRERRGWGWSDIDSRMAYVGMMWRFEVVARVSQYTAAESENEDHCVRLWQLSFVLAATNDKPERLVAGGQLAKEIRDDGNCDVIAWEVEASSHKGGEIERRKK